MRPDEDDFLMISALEHLEFCPRQCALIHVEGVWTESAQTAQGRVLHERAHNAPSETVNGVRIARHLRICSHELGLVGVADVVEFHPIDASPPPTAPLLSGVVLPGLPGRWQPFPVEYKRGRKRTEMSYFVQVCAQALCLEEMLKVPVPAGALYHCQSRRRQEVVLSPELRERTQARARELHEMISAGRVPPPEHGAKCKFCSLMPQCVPKLPPSRSASDYLAASVREILSDSDSP